MKLRVLFLLAVPLCALGCTSSKPETSSRYSNAFKPRDVKTVKAEEAPIVAGKTSKVYHTRHCRYAAALNGVVGYATARDAEIKGLIPCEFCNPQLNAASVTPQK